MKANIIDARLILVPGWFYSKISFGRQLPYILGLACMISFVSSLPRSIDSHLIDDDLARRIISAGNCDIFHTNTLYQWCGVICYLPGVGGCEFGGYCGYNSNYAHKNHPDANSKATSFRNCNDNSSCPLYPTSGSSCDGE